MHINANGFESLVERDDSQGNFKLAILSQEKSLSHFIFLICKTTI